MEKGKIVLLFNQKKSHICKRIFYFYYLNTYVNWYIFTFLFNH